MRSAKPAGMLFSPNELPTPSCGTPSMNTLMCLPLNPSSESCISEPTPPDSRTFIPGAFAKASLRLRLEFSKPFVSSATALKAERFRRLIPLETMTTSSSSSVLGRMVMFCLMRSPLVRVTCFSTVSYPMADTTSV